MDWVEAEMRTLDLGDKRLNNRLFRVTSRLSQNPAESIPAACGSWKETKAAYRLFDNDDVTGEKLLNPHKVATMERMKLCPTVLILQDTTTLSFPTQLERNDAGPINRANTRGMFLHPNLAVTPEGECLGVLSAHRWHREKLANKTPQERKKDNFKRPLSQKESYRWLQGYRLANQYAKELPTTQVVSISDREGDVYEIFQEAQETLSAPKAFWLIRSHHTRKPLSQTREKGKEDICMVTKNEKPMGFIEFELPSSINRKCRMIRQSIHVKKVCLSLPDRKTTRSGYRPVEITVIVASEVNTPKDEKPIEWTLLTNLPVDSFEEACEKIQWYTRRWQIEIYFKILKSGCKIEKLQLSDDNFSACLSIYMVIAWRILHLTMLGRRCPNLPCDCVFSKEEWQTVFVMVKRKKPPLKPPNLNDMIRMAASLGGFMNRRTDPEPGPKTLWVGLSKLQEHIKARQVFSDVFGHTYG